MPATEAQIRASRENGAKSKGPVTPEGKEKSRANSYKHGLTGSGTVLPEREAAEVQRRYKTFVAELKPTGEVGFSIALHAARMSVRMERAAEHESAMLTARVRQALADYEVPEGLDEAGFEKLRAEISYQATFDYSKEATLARKYEAAAARGFFKAIKELRVLEKQKEEVEAEMLSMKSGSTFLSEMSDEELDRLETELAGSPFPKPTRRIESNALTELRSRVDLPFAVGMRP